MNLDLLQIKEITTGAARIEKTDDGFCFYRFTQEQEALYKDRSDDFYQKTFCTSGIKMRFSTNSQSLVLRTDISVGTTRFYFAFEVFVNGERIGTLDNFSNVELPRNYGKYKLPFGEFSKRFDLGAGEKEVCVYFPWSVKTVVKELVLDDGAYIKPNKRNKKMLIFGDSITHGYDALYPSNKYITKLADMLDAEEYNKAIGGEIYFPELAAAKEDFAPDYIVVSYGSNDWNRCTKDVLIHNCKGFLNNLRRNYPAPRIIVLTPIWRKDMNETRDFGAFETVADVIQEQAAGMDNVSVIKGFEFVPQDESLFGDLRLHPSDKGFEYFFESLRKELKDILEV